MELRRIPGLGMTLATVLCTASPTIVAQTSANYRLYEHATNGGGHPVAGLVLFSPSFRVTLDAIGDSVSGVAGASGSFHLSSGFVGGYVPPGEVSNVRLPSPDVLDWDPEKSAGAYNVYRADVITLPGGYGACSQFSVAGTTATDPSAPSAGQALFYLVTVKNLLHEEGTKGFDSAGVERSNPAPCP